MYARSSTRTHSRCYSFLGTDTINVFPSLSVYCTVVIVLVRVTPPEGGEDRGAVGGEQRAAGADAGFGGPR